MPVVIRAALFPPGQAARSGRNLLPLIFTDDPDRKAGAGK